MSNYDLISSKNSLVIKEKTRPFYASTGGSEHWGQPVANYAFVVEGAAMRGYVISKWATSSTSANLADNLMPTEIPENDQRWYWSAAWQEKECEANRNLEEGDYEDFDSVDDFIASL